MEDKQAKTSLSLEPTSFKETKSATMNIFLFFLFSF